MGSIRIVLTDDHPVVRMGLRALLDSEPDIQVVGEANNGVEALNLVASLMPDIVVMDFSIPDM